MSKKKAVINSKTVCTMEISPNFVVEAEKNGDVLDFWLTRKGVTAKHYMFGAVPKDETKMKTMKGLLRTFEELLCDPTNETVRAQCKLLLNPGEKLKENSLEIVME